MPYRQFEMVRGDMDRGGFLGGLASIAKGALKVGVGFLAGGPVGAGTALVKHAAEELRGSGAAQPIGSSPAPIPSNIIVAKPINQTPAEELVRQHQVNIHRAQAAGVKIGPGVGAQTTVGRISPMRMGGRRRTMRVTNVKALRRAIRRATGFSKLAMKVIKVVNPQRKGRFGGWKKAKRR